MIGTAEEDNRTEIVRREILFEEATHESSRTEDLRAGDLIERERWAREDASR